MKRSTTIIMSLFIFLSMLSCNSGNDKANMEDVNKNLIVKVTKEYALEPSLSKATWSRYLDQKPTKQNIQLFGANVDVELGEVQMNTSGNASITSGNLSITDDTLKHATIVFDMASFKLSKEKGNGLFDVVTYPNSELDMESFAGPDSLLIINGNLIIQKTSKPVEIKARIDRKEEICILKGSFSFNTLDFPLRDKVKASDVKQDVITINFELQFKQLSVKKDTIR